MPTADGVKLYFEAAIFENNFSSFDGLYSKNDGSLVGVGDRDLSFAV